MKPKQFVVLHMQIDSYWLRKRHEVNGIVYDPGKQETCVKMTLGVRGVNGLPDVPSHVLRMYPDHRGISQEPITPTESARES